MSVHSVSSFRVELLHQKFLRRIFQTGKLRITQKSKYSGVEVNRRHKQGQLSKEVHNTGAYSELCQTSKMDFSVKMING